jgi:hypothetical protein
MKVLVLGGYGLIGDAAVLFGTGAGIAFFMLMAQRSARADLVAHVAGTVVIADTTFAATAVVVQPITADHRCVFGPSLGMAIVPGLDHGFLAALCRDGPVLAASRRDPDSDKKSGPEGSHREWTAVRRTEAPFSYLVRLRRSRFRCRACHSLADGHSPTVGL